MEILHDVGVAGEVVNRAAEECSEGFASFQGSAVGYSPWKSC